MSIKESAAAVLVLRHKYDSWLDCIKGQRPELLDDAQLRQGLREIKRIEGEVQRRLQVLAGVIAEDDDL